MDAMEWMAELDGRTIHQYQSGKINHLHMKYRNVMYEAGSEYFRNIS